MSIVNNENPIEAEVHRVIHLIALKHGLGPDLVGEILDEASDLLLEEMQRRNG